MGTMELTQAVEDIKTLQRMIEELTAEMESKKDEIKAEMNARSVSELSISCYKVRYTDVTTTRFDTTAFKKTHAELYAQYAKATTSKRFSIA